MSETNENPEIGITFNCGFCPEKVHIYTFLPDKWRHFWGSLDDNNMSFCPEHAAAEPFAQAQCPGCVEGWGDCRLWYAIERRRGHGFTEQDFQKIREGICPKRSNGTFSFQPENKKDGIQAMHLHNPAPPGSGQALLDAIRDYQEHYKEYIGS